VKIVCLFGSPRSDGNSTAIAERFVAAVEGPEIRISTFELNRLDYRGCQGCCACKTGREVCVLKDDLTDVLEAVREADAVALATPVYMGDVPGQVKCFVDRTFSFLKPDYVVAQSPSRVTPGKEVILIISQGAPEDEMTGVGDRCAAQIQFTTAAGEVHLIRAAGVGSGGIPKDVDERHLSKADELARALVTKWAAGPLPHAGLGHLRGHSA
jgi:multimeric flavodoxin WrbA